MRPLLVAPAAIDAYRVQAAFAARPAPASPAALAPSVPAATEAPGRSFGDVLSRAIQGGVQQTREADAATTQALTGQAGATEVVLAVTKAELALQTAVALRDRVVAAYQDIMRMPI